MDDATLIKHSDEEVGASTREGKIELFFPSVTGVVRVNLSLKLAVALAHWILWHWQVNCWWGLRIWWRERRARKILAKQIGETL